MKICSFAAHPVIKKQY